LIQRIHPQSRGTKLAQTRDFLEKVNAFVNWEAFRGLVEKGGTLSRKRAWSAIRAYGQAAGLPLPAHAHMLRHACGFALSDQGADTRLIQDPLGHRNIQNTVQYTAANPARFERLWR